MLNCFDDRLTNYVFDTFYGTQFKSTTLRGVRSKFNSTVLYITAVYTGGIPVDWKISR